MEANTMRLWFLNIIIGVFLFFTGPSLLRAEGGAEEGGSHGEKVQVKAEKKLAELMTLQNEIQGLESNVRAKKENLKKLLEEKQHSSNPTQSRELIKAIEKEYKDFRESDERLENKRTQMRFRFPEKGTSEKKESAAVGESLKEVELEASADSEAREIISLLRKKYGKKVNPTTNNNENKNKSKAPHGEDLDSVITIKK
jgi:hypothetical protein